MADAVSSQTLVDGPRNTVIKYTNLSDGTGESGVTKVDASTLEGSPTNIKIDGVWFNCSGMSVQVDWDGGTPATALILADEGAWDFRCFGGIQNNAGSPNNDITFTTGNASSGDSYTIILFLRKN